MKGTTFQKPLELNLLIEGESWNQGDTITGSITVRNHGNEAVALNDLTVALAHGALRKVHAKTQDALEIVTKAPFEGAGSLEPKGQTTLDWKFALERNSPITDKSSSLFVIYGKGETAALPGVLQLNVTPFPLMLEYLKEFTTQYRFVLKGLRASAKGCVDAKLEPPDSRAFQALDYVTVSLKMKGDNLEVKYAFTVKAATATVASVDVTKKKREVKQSLEPKQYMTESGRVNHAFIEGAIKAALAEVESKGLF